MARNLYAAVMVMLVAVSVAEASVFTVGGSKGWSEPSGSSQAENLNQWAQRLRFHIGDQLEFTYPAKQDSVLMVTKEAFEKCNTTAPMSSHDDGKTVITLPKSGPFYFISGAQGHCEKGQKLVVVVMSQGGRKRGSAAAPSPTSAVAASPLTSPFSESPLGAPAMAPTAGSATKFSAGAVGLAAVLVGAFLF